MAAPAGSVVTLAPLATPLPPGPEGENFSKAQWDILLALMDTVVPRIVRADSADNGKLDYVVSDAEYDEIAKRVAVCTNAPDTATLDAYLAERPSENEQFQDMVMRQFVFFAKDEQRQGLKFILSTLSTRAGSLLLTGYATPLIHLDAKTRTAILNGWRTHYLPPLRILYKSLTSVAKLNYLRTSPLLPAVTGYKAVPANYNPPSSFDFNFLRFPAAPTPATLDFDVVIVGSGIGGGVSAKNLAEAGFSVLVVDKSYYYPPERLPMTESEGLTHLYENGGFDVSQDSSLNFISGSNWGGGGSVNWSASLQLQGYVRKEWAQDRKLPLFESAEFQDALDRVCERMGVSAEHIKHSHGNQVLLEGARKLGHTAKAVPQNTGGNEHSCAHCTLGCGAGEKQGPNVCWLPDAGRAGAQFMEGYKVERILFETQNGKKTAVGVSGVWTKDGVKREVVVNAHRVVISAGSLSSPVLLKDSGLTNKHIGRNLYMHPVNSISAFFAEDVRPWEGPILTTVCTSFENLDGHGHGTKLEATCMMPTLSCTMLNWKNGVDWKVLAAKYRHMNTYISIVRDRDPGRVLTNPPRVEYAPSTFDRRHALVGVLELAKMLLVAGAAEIHPHIGGVEPFIVKDSERSITAPEFVSWLRNIESIGNAPPMGLFSCAHQMGSNRMSATPDAGVVDPNGKVWGVERLYIADASVFPSASGVNPMVTNLAISDVTSRRIAAGLKKERGERL